MSYVADVNRVLTGRTHDRAIILKVHARVHVCMMPPHTIASYMHPISLVHVYQVQKRHHPSQNPTGTLHSHSQGVLYEYWQPHYARYSYNTHTVGTAGGRVCNVQRFCCGCLDVRGRSPHRVDVDGQG